MQIVIEIPDEVYKEIQDGKMYRSVYDIPQESVKAIKNGTPLPKGHGRLIDAEIVDSNIYDLTQSLDLNYNQISRVLYDAPTIIESDKGVN